MKSKKPIVVEDFSVAILPHEKIVFILYLLYQDYPNSSHYYIELLDAVRRYFPDIDTFLKDKNESLLDAEYQLEWLKQQLKKKLGRDIHFGDFEEIYTRIREHFFKYIANHHIVRDDGYINSMLISAYKKACKILIEEGIIERLITYIEGYRNCEGFLNKEFLEKYRNI